MIMEIIIPHDDIIQIGTDGEGPRSEALLARGVGGGGGQAEPENREPS